MTLRLFCANVEPVSIISNIIQKCIEESENQTSFYQFTKKINSEFSYEKKNRAHY